MSMQRSRVASGLGLLVAWVALGGRAVQAQSPVVPAPSGAEAAAVLEVSGFQVSGNTLLSSETLQQVLASFKGRRTLAELQAAARAVQRRYTTEGYGGVVAYLPPQGGVSGQVHIAVLEGQVASVTVRGQAAFDEATIRASLPALQVGTTPNLRQIDLQMQIANENPARQTRVLLKPGVRAGETAAEVNLAEGPLQGGVLGLNDTGSGRAGVYRATLSWRHANFSGADDVLSVQYQTSPTHLRQVTVLSASHRLPLYRQFSVLDVFMVHSNVDGGSTATAAGELRFNGSGRTAGLRLTRLLPRWGEADQRLSVGLEHREYLNHCEIVGLPEGACGAAGESVLVQPLTLDYSLQQGGSGVHSAGLTLSVAHNLRGGGRHGDAAHFAAVRPGATPRYTTWRLALSGGMALADTWQIQARLVAQHSEQALVSGEQFGLSGASTVRGYGEREVTGDSGAVAGLEVLGPPLLGGMLRLLGFTEAGQVRNRLGTPCLGAWSPCTLVSWGLGGRWQSSPWQAGFYVAEALRDGAQTRRHHARVHFTLQYAL